MTHSLKYHRLHPEYVHTRIERLRGMYLLRVLLLICDVVSWIYPLSLSLYRLVSHSSSIAEVLTSRI